MTREEVKVVFTGLAHDHMMASPSTMHSCNTQSHQIKRSSHHLDESRNHYNNSRIHNHHNHHHQHHHHQPLGGCTSENLPRAAHLQTQNETASITNGANQTTSEANGTKRESDNQPATALSTIAILRRHPMYDSLVLVKKYRPCLGGYTLEFPIENDSSNGSSGARSEETNKTGENGVHGDESASCGRTKLVSVYLDGDDPIYQSQQEKLRQQSKGQQSEVNDGEVVYVPVNGLMDRLENYDRHGIAIDSRVYAFAMGLKTAERFLTSSTVKEMQEAPPL